jgi:hypothetical protein
MVNDRRFPMPWRADKAPRDYVVRDVNGEALPMLRTVGIRMARPFARLAIGLQAVIEPVQQFADHGAADLVTHVAQALAELAQSLARP